MLYVDDAFDDATLFGVVRRQAFTILSMVETSDIPYHVLDATYQQYLRLSTL